MFSLEELQKMNKNDLISIINNCISDQEMLKEEKKTLIWLNQDLKKQVDELKAKKEISIKNIEDRLTEYYFMGCSYGAIVSGKMSISIAQERAKEYAPILYDFVNQIGQDTAKEIFAELFYIASIHHSDVANILAWAKEKAKSKGIEVE